MKTAWTDLQAYKIAFSSSFLLVDSLLYSLRRDKGLNSFGGKQLTISVV